MGLAYGGANFARMRFLEDCQGNQRTKYHDYCCYGCYGKYHGEFWVSEARARLWCSPVSFFLSFAHQK